jgi:peptide deformylase
MTKLTSIFTEPQIVKTPGKNIPEDQINSKQTKQLTQNLLHHLDKLNLAAITPQNIFPNNKQTTLENHLLNILIFRNKNGNPQIVYNPKIKAQPGEQLVYERCGSIEINENYTLDAYTKRTDIITLSGHNFAEIYNQETAAYIQHELDHLNGITISDRNKQLTPTQIKQIDSEVEPKLIIKENGNWKIINRTIENQQTPNSINFDYIKQFHQGIENQLKFLK